MKSLVLLLFVTILKITTKEINSSYLLVDLENQELNGVGRSLQARELSKFFWDLLSIMSEMVDIYSSLDNHK